MYLSAVSVERIKSLNLTVWEGGGAGVREAIDREKG